MSEFANILAFCKSLAATQSDDSGKYSITLAVPALQHYIATRMSTSSKVDDCHHLDVIKFMIEQLELMHTTKNGRRYSATTLTRAFM